MRRIFDEATGVTRYKFRRREALRRLLDARQDRDRALDILAEVERQANALKRQVAKVRAYNRLRLKSAQIRAAIVLQHVRTMEERLAPLTTSLEQQEREVHQLAGDLSAGEARVLSLEGELLELENGRAGCSKDYEAAQGEYRTLTARKAHIEEEMRLNKWRQENSRKERERISIEAKEVDSQIESAEGSLQHAKTVLPGHENNLAESQKQFAEADEKFREARSASIQCRQQLDDLREGEAETIRLGEERKAAIRSLNTRQEQLIQQQEELKEEFNTFRSELSRHDDDLNVRGKHLEDLRRKYDSNKEKIEKLRIQIRQKEDEYNQVSALADRVSLQIDHFKELHRRSSPVYSAGGALATEFPEIVSATLGDEIQTEQKYVRAVESTLLSMAYTRVVEQHQSFETLLKYANEHRVGRAAILVEKPPKFEIGKASRFAQRFSGKALAEVIDGGTSTSEWIRYFLRNSILFESIRDLFDAAHEAAEQGLTLVTLAGEYTDGQGLWIIGNSGDQPPQSEIADLRQQLALAEAELLSAEKHQRDAEQSYDLVKIEKLKLEAKIASLQATINQLKEEAKSLPGKTQALRLEDETSSDDLSGALEKISSLEEELHRQQEIEARTLEEREIIRQRHAEIQIELERAQAEVQRVDDRLSELKERKQRMETRESRLLEEESSLRASSEGLAKELEIQNVKATEAGALTGELREQLETIDSKRRDLQESLRIANVKVRELREQSESISQRMHQLQLEKVQVEAALKEEKPKLADIDPGEIEDVKADPEALADLERKLIAMEPLNLAAESEYEDSKQRLDFLNDQINDLNDAEKSLEETITTLNQEAKERFETGFARIKENFKNIFAEIFDGGKADFTLSEEDSLESRVEILASPAGKRTVHLSLLSGGEKALTAIALLFAIYLEKPSPFCILDEVDAPLDDENTMRFTRLLEKFTPTTQFLIVTHNKRTMEVAKNLLGVTMEEDGISKVVPVQIN
jgi:chromosome segregation protein